MTSGGVIRQKDVVQGMLHKSVIALAIVPTNRSLTVTGRKAYSVMLGLAQLQAAAGEEGADGGFSAPLNAILRGFGATNSISSDAKRYIDQMISTKVEWRPLSKAEQQIPLLFDAKANAEPSTPQPVITDELRIFNLLAEVRIYKQAGENWVTWYYPPSLREELVSPTRWAQIDFDVLKELTTYCSVTLYEICARYRDSPAGVTSRQHWTWWTETLRSSPTSKVRVWRKFKNEFLVPAIKEINTQGDIEVELIEFRRGREVEQVQFAVKRSQRKLAKLLPTPADVTNIMRGAALGVREAVIEDIERQYGARALEEGLDRLERFLKGNDRVGRTGVSGERTQIQNVGAYLRKIVANSSRDAPEPRAASEETGVSSAAPVVLRSAASAPVSSSARSDEERHRRYMLVRERFEHLPAEEQLHWVHRVRDEADVHANLTPAIKRRLWRGEWQSPLVQVMVINFYARAEFGPDWTSLPLDAFGAPDAARVIDLT
jgi:hypothetical protein